MGGLYIIDGSSMLSSAYYATLPKEVLYTDGDTAYEKIMHTTDGLYTNGVLGMLCSVLNIIRDWNPEYMAFVFDQTRDTFRRRIYPEYKGTRKDTPEPLKQQFITMQHILEIFGFRIFCSQEYEADDYAASIVEQFCGEAGKIVLYSKDMDYLQLVDDARGISVRMSCRNRKNGASWKEYTEKELEEDYGLTNGRQVVDYKALTGDKSDNIPGVKGIGPRAAVPLITKYGSVENLYCAIEEEGSALEKEWKTLGIRGGAYKRLAAGKKEAFMSLRLAEMKKDIPLSIKLGDLKYCVEPAVLREVIRSYGLKSLNTYIE